MQADAASEAFQKVLEDIPSGIPHPDGSQRIRNISRKLSKARDEWWKLTGFWMKISTAKFRWTPDLRQPMILPERRRVFLIRIRA
jgi:hypothetical protein